MPWEATMWLMVERTGWTLEYIGGLDVAVIAQANQVWAGQRMAQDRK